MTDLAILARDTSALDQYADPGRFVELACERAKDWLRQALERGDIEGIADLKSQAEAIRTYTVQKQLGKDTELSAAEIVRRAERGIGMAIRKGQEEGEMLRRGDVRNQANQWGSIGETHNATIPSPKDYLANTNEASAVYAITDDVTDEQFDDAIEEAKQEGNLSRANVVRTVTRNKILSGDGQPTRLQRIKDMAAQGNTSDQIATELGCTRETVVAVAKRNNITLTADNVVRGTRRLESNRVVRGIVDASGAPDSLINLIDYSALDSDELAGWVISLSDAIRSLTTLKKNLNKEITSREQQ